MRQWSLGQLTVIGVSPYELAEIAARAGYDAIDPLVGMVDLPGIPATPLREGDPETVKMVQSLKANGIAVNIADAFVLNADTEMDDLRRFTALAASLGAKAINAIPFDEDRTRSVAQLAALADLAADAGLGLLMEFMAICAAKDVHDAAAMIGETGSGNIRLMYDALHLAYSGGGPADMRKLSSTIGGAQLCDAPASLSFDEYYRMTMGDRMYPGAGELPLAEFMAALPADMICAVEAPWLQEPDLVIRASRALTAARSVDGAIMV